MSVKDHPGWESVINALTREEAESAVYDWITGDHWYGYPSDSVPGQMKEATRAEEDRLRPDIEARVARIITILDKAEKRRGHPCAISDKLQNVMFPAEMMKQEDTP